MRTKRFTILLVSLVFAVFQSFSQSIATGYTVGTWSGFRTSAATFTFDDGCANQENVMKYFDKYKYKASFYPPTSWVSDWSTFINRVKNGHEVGSHSVSHGNTMPDSEIKESKDIINSKITGQDCNTITYPNCNEPSESELAKYYIGGRICNGQVEGPTPSNYFQIGSLICGNQGSYNDLSSFKSAFNQAINKKGWAVFLVHEIDNGSGYSPLSSSVVSEVIEYVHDNDEKIWLTTFRNAILYAKERNALSLSETTESSKLKLTASVNITSSVVEYNYPITVRRELPNGWTNFAAATDGNDIEVTVLTSGSKTYAQFDVIPGKTYYLEDRESEYTNNSGGGGGGESTVVNLIYNGEFDDGTSGWTLQENENATAEMTAVTTANLSGDNAIRVCPSNYGTDGWHIQLLQNVDVEAGKEYTLSFTAKADRNRSMAVWIQQISADYAIYASISCNLTTTAQEFSETFIMPSDVDPASKLTFCIGGENGCVFIDNVFFGYEDNGGGGGDNPHYDVDITGDISKYFIDKAYVGPSCDALEGESVTNGAYYTGEYTNLFVKYLGKTQEQVDQKIQTAWNHFFNPSGSNRVYYETNDNMAYIFDTGNNDVRTEGMSYGMMICVQLGHQTEFDKLWRWAKKYMQHPSGSQMAGLFAWQCGTDGTKKDEGCAPDGEMYFLTALWFASHRWGNDGDINYEQDAQYLAKMILEKSGRGNGQVSPLFNYSNHIVTFGATSYDFTDPSYNLPGFLELWARWSDTHQDFWAQTPAAARGLLKNSCHSTSGLFPDYSSFNGQPYKPSWAGYNTERYQYDASRSAMNVGMDYHWFAADNNQPAMMERILKFFQNDGFSHGYFNWDGSSPDGNYNEAMQGANGAAVLALQNNNELAKTYAQRLWNTNPPTGQYRYYNGMVYFLGLLNASGYFKIYKPCPEVIEEELSGPAPVEFNGEEYSTDTTFKALVDCKIYNVTITITGGETTTYTVTFVDYDDTVLKTQTVASGKSATAPDDPTREGYTFAGWDKAFNKVTKDLTVKATYTENGGGEIITGDLSQYFIDNAYIGPSCDALEGEEVTDGAYFTGEYTNLFVKYLGKTQSEVDQKMQSLWNHFFTVNGQNTVYYETNNNMAYIYDTGNGDVRTEGMSYGLMICLQMGDQNKFDKIWRWAKTYMQYKSGDQREGLFAWQCETNGNIKGASCAPDGEMYFLTALWFASHRWGNDGDINYEQEAQYLAKMILEKPNKQAGAVSPIFNYDNHIVTFGETSYAFTDPSYNLPGFLELWARWSDTHKDFWVQTPAAARGLLQDACHPTTGLFPDYSQFDGTPYHPDWQNSYDTRRYQYDASRSAMNVGMDYNWFASDDQQPAMMERLLKFFQSDNFQHGYFDWDGRNASDYYNQAMHGSNGVAVFALKNNPSLESLAQTYVQRLWDAQVPTGQWRYYNGMVYFLSMLHASGYFKIYKPMPEVVVENLSGPSPVAFNGMNFTKDTAFTALVDCKIYNVTITIEAATKYTVTFVDYNDDVLKTEEVTSGESATAPTEPTREGYDFAGWDTEFNNVTDNLTVKATYTVKTFTVTFVDYDDSPIGTAQTVEYGKAATAPAEPTREHFTFKEWDTDFSSVKADLTVKAVYEENAKADYTALNEAIALAESKDEEEFTAVSWSALQTALTAAKAVDTDLYADDQSVVDAATSALTAAIAALQEITFTVTFVDWDDSPIGDAQTIKKGGAATAPSNPTREGYTFIGWDTEFNNVTEDLTVKATYNKKDAGSKYEAENAQGNGTQTVSNNTASGGKYVKMVEGSLTFTVNVENAGMYTATFAYSLTEDFKAQNLSVNGSQVGTVSFTQSGTSNPTFATVEVCVKLDAGANTIALTKSWGYVDIDYLEISSYERTQFNIDEALVTPNPQPATIEVYEFLKDNFGKKTISGVMTLDLLDGNNTLPLASQSEVSYINSKSNGKTPALVGFDFMHSTGKNSTNSWQMTYTSAALEMAEELWNAGGIPTFSWHWRDPNQNGDDFYTNNTSFDLTNAFTNSSYTEWNTNSTEYKNMIKDIDIIAGYLKQLQCAGVSILWRPIHEASGKWFWWGAKGAEPYKQLYKLMFDRLVNYHHLNNLIWVWNSDGTDADWYPGDAYVDVVGRDFYYGENATYNHSSLVTDFESLAKLTNGKKLVTLAENGAVPYPENMDNDDAMWSWFMPWYGEYVTDSKHNTTSDWSTIMNDSRVITLSDMGGWDNRTKIYDTTTVGTLYAKNGFSVTPSVEGDSEQEITVTSSHNCDSVVVLYLHADAAAIVTYTVTFVDYDGTTLKTEEVESGKSATAPTTSTRENYTFKEWDTDFSNVTSDLTVIAVYTENGKADYTALNAAIELAEGKTESDFTEDSWSALQTALTAAKAVDKNLYAESQSVVDAATEALTSAIDALVEKTFTVTFLDKDGNELKQQTVKKGESATAPEAPEVEGFTFSGWSGSYENVTADVTITAQYTEHGKADYTALNAAIAQAEALTEGDYTAQSWSALQTALTAAKSVDKDLYAEDQAIVDNATSALTSAMSALVEQTYTVTFLGKDGNELKKQTVKKGESATAPEAPEIEGFTFSGWSGLFANVTADVTVTAQYTEHGKADYTALNNAIAQAEAMVEEDYTAETWSALQSALTAAKAVDKDLYAEDQAIVDAATSALQSAMSALVEKTFTVTFYDWDGRELKKQTVKKGESASAPTQPTREGFQFAGWEGSFTNVTSDVDVVATYTENMADYSGLNEAISQAEALQSIKFTAETWAVVESALATAKNIEKNLPVSYQLTIDNAKQSLLLAIESLTMKTFTVQFVVDGQVVATQTVKYGESANAPSSPQKEGYKFVGWNGEYSNVTADATVTAEFAIQTYTVTFVDFDGSELDKQTVEYGKSATKPADPSRDGFEFSGWVGDYTNVTADMVVRASYTEIGMAIYTQLDNAIAKAEALLQNKYSPETWSAVQSALNAAKAVDRHLEEEFQSVVDDAENALNAAINALKLNTFKVKFVVDGTVIDEQTIEYGGSAKMPTVIPEKDGYDFVQWSGSFINVTEDINIVAEFALKEQADYSSLDAAIARANAVENKKYSQESLDNLQSALYNASLLDRNLYAEQQSLVNATTRAILDAIDGLTLKTFTVTFKVDGTPVWTQTISYGGAALAPAAPTKAGYTFVRWNGSYSYVTEDMTIDAVFAVNQTSNVDKTILNHTISEANAAISKADNNVGSEPGQYPATAVLALQDAIDAANEIYETAQRQIVVDNEVTILSNAIEVFLESINPEKPDMSELTVLIKHATRLLETTSVGDKPGQYPRLQNWELSNAVQDGNALYDKKRLDQATVDAQVEVLREKIDAYLNSEIKDNTAVSDINDNGVRIYSKGHHVVVENAEIQDVQIYDISGRCISKNGQNAVSETEIFVEKPGMYIVKVGIIARRVVIK